MFLARPRAAHCAILGRLAYTNTRDTSQRSLTAHVLGKVTVAALDQALIPKPVAYPEVSAICYDRAWQTFRICSEGIPDHHSTDVP